MTKDVTLMTSCPSVVKRSDPTVVSYVCDLMKTMDTMVQVPVVTERDREMQTDQKEVGKC